MIRGLFLLIVATLSLLSSSAKENAPSRPLPLFSAPVNTPAMVYSSDWETVPAWQLAEGSGSLLYTYIRPLEQASPEVIKEGVVLVFARGYDFVSVSKAEEKPLGLPFYMALANENVVYPYAWSYSPQERKVTIGLSMDSSLQSGFMQAGKDIQLRFFVLSPGFLKQYKLTAKAARSIPYNRLVDLLNTTP